MARGRMVATTIALDPDFNAMSFDAQLMFLRTVPHLDRDGLIIGQPAALWATIAPLLPDLLPRMQCIVDEWEAAGLVTVFSTSIGAVLFFSGFRKNQVGMRYDREPKSQLPVGDGFERTPDGIRQVSGKLPADYRQPSGRLPEHDSRSLGTQHLPEVEMPQELPASIRQSSGKYPLEVEREVEVERVLPATTTTDSPVWKAWTDNMPGVLTPHLVDSVNELIDEHGDGDVVKAILIAVERNKRNLGYIRGILRKGLGPPSNGTNGVNPFAGMVFVPDEDDDQ